MIEDPLGGSFFAYLAGGSVALLAGSAGLAAMSVPLLRERVLPRPKETRLSDFLPMDTMLDDGMTIRCRDKSLARVVEIGGVDQSFLKDGEQVPLFLARQEMIDSLADYNVSLRFYLRRRTMEMPIFSEFQNPFARITAKRWNSQFSRSFSNRLYIVVGVPGGNGDAGMRMLDEAIATLSTTMREYGPRVLTQDRSSGTTVSRFFSELCSPLTAGDVIGHGSEFSAAITGDTVEFLSDGLIRFSHDESKKYAAIVGIRRLGDNTSTLLANELASLACELTVLQIVEPIKKGRAMLLLQQNKAMMASTSFSASVHEQYHEALEAVEGFDEAKATLCNFTESVIVYGATAEEAHSNARMVTQVMVNNGFRPVIEKGTSQASFFQQFPSVSLWTRYYRLLSHNIALLSTFDRPSVGYLRSAWGDGPVALFKTSAGTPYSHQFHANDALSGPPVAHGICIAPTGGGKTTLFCFLSMMASRHGHVSSYIFDRYKGSYIYTAAMGGKYLGFNAEPEALSIRGGMNPFQMEDTLANRDFLRLWLQAISGVEDPRSMEEISRAIDIAYMALDDSQRSLANIHGSAFTPNSPLYNELTQWVSERQHGALFNAEQDALDLSSSQLVTFDMTNIFDDQRLSNAAISYILHRIRTSMTVHGNPALIFIDETEPMLKDPIFRGIYLMMLQEFRKIGGSVISVFQRPEAIKNVSVAEAVRQQSACYYLFPNPGASPSDYSEFDLNDREMSFVMGTSPVNKRVKRGLLIKRPSTRESVVVDVDLSTLGPLMRVFSSDNSDVRRASALQREHGSTWLKYYLA